MATILPYLRPSSQGANVQRRGMEGQTVMTNSGPYVMQGASSGGVPMNFRAAQQPQITGPAWGTPDNMYSQVGGQMTVPEGVRVGQIQQSYGSNLNPNLMGGLVDVQLPNGQVIQIANPIMQSLQFQDQVNKGRGNATAEFFGLNQQRPQGMGYTDYGASIGQMNEWNRQNPLYTQQGAINPYVRHQQQQQEGQTRINRIQNELQNNVFTERVGQMGQPQGVNQRQQKEQELRQAQASMPDPNAFNSRQSKRIANEQEAMGQKAVGKVPQITPTYSNLPIRETYRG